MWTHVLDFLSLFVMLRLFQTCRAFCALKRGVRTLDFGETPIVQEANALTALRLILGSVALVTLDLSYTKFCSTLESLDLSSNQLCGLDLHGNGTCTDVGIKALAKALRVSSALTSLNLCNKEISSTGAAALAEALQVSSALKNVDLVLNCIEGESAQQLVAAALESKTLEVFSTVPIKQLHEECSFCPPASKALGRLNGLFRFGTF